MALGGLACLGACAALGSGELSTASRGLPTGLLPAAGALVLTGPALLVGHQFLRLSASPEALVGVAAHAFVRAGKLALGLSPFMLFFAATSGRWLGLYALLMTAIAGNGLFDVVAALQRIEAETGAPAALERQWKMRGLAHAWAVLTGLVGLRIAVDAAWLLGGG